MQINIDKKSGIFITIIVILLVTIGALFLGQGMRHPDDNRSHYVDRDSGMSMNNPENNSPTSFQGNDIMFAQMMIPHHEQAVEISDVALLTSKNPEVLTLAKAIRDAQTPEILQMKAWLTQTNSSSEMGHSMDGGMGGMLSEGEVSTLKSASGSAFDKLFLAGMIAHHEGAIHMTMMIKDSNSPEVKNLGESIVSSQTAQIVLMKEILTRIP